MSWWYSPESKTKVTKQTNRSILKFWTVQQKQQKDYNPTRKEKVVNKYEIKWSEVKTDWSKVMQAKHKRKSRPVVAM